MKAVSLPILATACCLPLFVTACKPNRDISDGRIQAALARVAVEAKEWYIREAAVEQITDQALLAKLAVEAKVCRTAVDKVTDQALLAKIAFKAKEPDVRRIAVKKLSDQALLAKVLVEAKDWDLRRTAFEKLTDPALLAKLAVEADDSVVRRAVAEKLTNQDLSAKVAVEDTASHVSVVAVKKPINPTALKDIVRRERNATTQERVTALLGIPNEEGLVLDLARRERDLTVCTTAILLLTNDTELKRLATEASRAVEREAAVVGVSDDAFLLRRARVDSSATVRLAAVRGLQSPEAIYTAATRAYYESVRDAAQDRLEGSMGEKVLVARREIGEKVDALSSAAMSELVETAIHGDLDVLCQAAAERLDDPLNLKRVILESSDREVIRIALGKLTDPVLLTDIFGHRGNIDPAVRLAVSRKLNRQSWNDIFGAAAKKPKAMGDALAAVAIFGTVQKDAKIAVEGACLALIRLGDESRITEMADLLEGYGSKELAEDYVNCGQPDLDKAGRAWAGERGYSVDTGHGSNRARWGSGK